MKPGRNDPCHCGSGKKYKKCHAATDDAAQSAQLAADAAKRAASAESDAATAPAKGARPAGSSGNVKRPKGPPPKSPTQLRRRAV